MDFLVVSHPRRIRKDRRPNNPRRLRKKKKEVLEERLKRRFVVGQITKLVYATLVNIRIKELQ
jgi:hypothetical protein